MFFMNEKTTFSKQFKMFFERHGKAISLSCFCLFTAAVLIIGAAKTVKKAGAEKEILKELNENLASDTVSVDVKGAVKNTGSFELPRGSKVSDAVDAAGGLSVNADTDNLNLSAPLENGAEITIPAADAPAQSPDGKINLNTASLYDLMSLDGIGEVTAQKIIDYRDKNGSFTNTEQLKNIDGIGDKTFENIKESIALE